MGWCAICTIQFLPVSPQYLLVVSVLWTETTSKMYMRQKIDVRQPAKCTWDSQQTTWDNQQSRWDKKNPQSSEKSTWCYLWHHHKHHNHLCETQTTSLTSFAGKNRWDWQLWLSQCLKQPKRTLCICWWARKRKQLFSTAETPNYNCRTQQVLVILIAHLSLYE